MFTSWTIMDVPARLGEWVNGSKTTQTYTPQPFGMIRFTPASMAASINTRPISSVVRKLPNVKMATSCPRNASTRDWCEVKSALITFALGGNVALEEERARIEMVNSLERRPLRIGSPRAPEACLVSLIGVGCCRVITYPYLDDVLECHECYCEVEWRISDAFIAFCFKFDIVIPRGVRALVTVRFTDGVEGLHRPPNSAESAGSMNSDHTGSLNSGSWSHVATRLNPSSCPIHRIT